MSETGLPEAAYEGEVYRWRCPECDEVNETEHDPRGSVETCESCGMPAEVGL